MTRRVAVVLALVAMIVVPMSGAALAATPANNSSNTTAMPSNETATTPGWQAPGPFDISELTAGGVHDSQAPPSVRSIGNPVRGSLGIRAAPVSPLRSEKDWVKPDTNIGTDEIQLYATSYGEATGEYELVIVYWQERTKQTENGTVEYAGNQSIQRVTFNLSSGYNKIPIDLRSFTDKKVEMSMWLEQDGEPIEGARWRFTHRSNPLAQSVPVSSKGDLWTWAGINILLPAIPGIFVGRKAATHALERTVQGPRKGTGWWLLVMGVLALIILGAATWQAGAVLSRAPFVAGLSVALLSFVAMLGMRDHEAEQAEFNQKDLHDVTAVDGDETKDARSETILIREIIRRNGRVYLPAKGIRPWLARYWAEPASVDESELETVNNTDGDVSKKFEIDPEADETLVHKPARLAFSPTIVEERDEDDDDPLAYAEDDDEQTTTEAAKRQASGAVARIMSALGRINWAFVAPAVLGGWIVYGLVNSWLGVPSVAALAGIFPALIAGYEPRDGHLEFELAPYHYTEARAVLAHERAKYTEAQTFEDLHTMLAEVDLDAIEQAQKTTEAIRGNLRERIGEVFNFKTSSGALTDDDSTDPQTGVGDD
jgi:hypothetical protein